MSSQRNWQPRKGKSHKRRSGWHSGGGQDALFLDAINALPVIDATVDYTQTGPVPIKKGPGNKRRGDAL